MEIKRYTLDRKAISSEKIRSRQDFSKVLSQKTGLTSLLAKKLFYFGTIGLASVITVLVVSFRAEQKVDSSQKLAQKSQPMKPKDLQQSKSFSSRKEQESLVSVEGKQSGLTSEIPKKEERKVEIVQEVKVKPTNLEETALREEKETNAPGIPEKSKLVVEPARLVNYSLQVPALAGVQVGPIYAEDLRENAELTLSDMSINSFSLTFFGANGEVTYPVNGTKIPETILSELIRYNKGFEFTITEIKATNKAGNQLSVPSMRLILK